MKKTSALIPLTTLVLALTLGCSTEPASELSTLDDKVPAFKKDLEEIGITYKIGDNFRLEQLMIEAFRTIPDAMVILREVKKAADARRKDSDFESPESIVKLKLGANTTRLFIFDAGISLDIGQDGTWPSESDIKTKANNLLLYLREAIVSKNPNVHSVKSTDGYLFGNMETKNVRIWAQSLDEFKSYKDKWIERSERSGSVTLETRNSMKDNRHISINMLEKDLEGYGHFLKGNWEFFGRR